MSSDSPGIALGVIGAFGALVYLGGHGRAPDKADQKPLDVTKDTYLGVRRFDDKPESSLTIKAPNGESWDLSLYAGGVPYQPK